MPKKTPKKVKGASKDHDFTVIARRVVEEAIGEKLDGSPLGNARKDPQAVERGRKGGIAGGRARAAKLSQERRKEIAKKAADARWGKDKS